jgi:hypothetical protein
MCYALIVQCVSLVLGKKPLLREALMVSQPLGGRMGTDLSAVTEVHSWDCTTSVCPPWSIPSSGPLLGRDFERVSRLETKKPTYDAPLCVA